MNPLIITERLTAGYLGTPVVHDVGLRIDAGEVVALLGANGAGKTTTLLTLSGLLRPMSGRTFLEGRDITHLAPHKIVTAGLAQVPEGRALARSLTVEENLRLVGRSRTDVYNVFPALEPLRDRPAGLLSGGEQQMLAIARALAMAPKALLVDELSLGLGPIVVRRLLDTLRHLASNDGLAVLLVEQHVAQALDVADRAYILSRGRVTAEGPAAQMRADRHVVESAYLGDADDPAAPRPTAASTPRSASHAP